MFRVIRAKLNKWCFLMACLHFVLSFFTDRLIFTYSLSDFSSAVQAAKSLLALGSKIAFFFVLLFVWHWLRYFVKEADRRFVKFTLIYLAFMCALLLLTYPGIFRMDEFGILFEAQKISPVFWQNYLTSVFYIFSLMLFPAPAGVVLMQCMIISVLVGRILTRLTGMVRGRWIWLMYVPFLLPPVLDSNLYPMRMSLYAFLELYLLVEFVRIRREMRAPQSDEIVRLVLLSAFVICWRSEAVYYIIALPACFVVLFYRWIDKKVISRFILLLFSCALILLVPQKIGDRVMNGDQYALTAVVLPVTPLISACSAQADATEDPDTKAELEKTLAVMDRVVNVELITEGYAQGRTGISMFWSEGDHFVRPHSPADFAAFRSAYYGLILRYPMVFLEERWTTFLQSEDLLENTTVIFDGTGVQNHERFAGLFLNRPISSSLRKKTIALLEMRSLRDYDEKIPAYHVVYHVMLPLCLLLLLLAGLLLRRRLDYAILLLSHLCKVPLIFLTAPSRLFMYYYPVYLTGVFAVTLLLVGKLSRTVGDDSVREKERERETADE